MVNQEGYYVTENQQEEGYYVTEDQQTADEWWATAWEDIGKENN